MANAVNKIIVVTMMSPGVARGGGGWVIVGGKMKRVPPRSPSLQKLAAAALALEQFQGLEGVEEMTKAATKAMEAAAQEL